MTQWGLGLGLGRGSDDCEWVTKQSGVGPPLPLGPHPFRHVDCLCTRDVWLPAQHPSAPCPFSLSFYLFIYLSMSFFFSFSKKKKKKKIYECATCLSPWSPLPYSNHSLSLSSLYFCKVPRASRAARRSSPSPCPSANFLVDSQLIFVDRL